MTQKEQIAGIVSGILADTSYYLIELKASDFKGDLKLIVLVDADQGINIDECAKLSKDIAERLEEEKIELAEIEVSSPGVGEPLLIGRQYVKNIGRNVKVLTNEGKIHIGKLLEVQIGNYLLLEEEVKEKGKKKITYTRLEIPFIQIKKTIVLVSFS